MKNYYIEETSLKQLAIYSYDDMEKVKTKPVLYVTLSGALEICDTKLFREFFKSKSNALEGFKESSWYNTLKAIFIEIV